MKEINAVELALLALAGWLGASLLSAQAAPGPAQDRGGGEGSKNAARAVVSAQARTPDDAAPEARAWLGVAVEEAPEALSEQLGLGPGVGLVVLHVSPDSPAAKAGLKKNDVLAELAGHALAHPGQLRRLVQARPPGEAVDLVFYRQGKRQTVSVTLGQAPPPLDLPAEPGAGREPWGDLRWGEAWRDWARQFREQWERLAPGPGQKLQKEIERSLEEARQALREATRRMSNAQPRIQVEIERSIEQARKALEEAVRQMSNAWHSFRGPAGPLKDLFKGGVRVDKNASVVVRSRGDTARSIAQSDDRGTVVIVGPPLRLTAHDKDGNLVFEGEIETPEQRAKVPPELWQRVEPLLDEPAAPPAPSKPRPNRRAPKGGEAL